MDQLKTFEVNGENRSTAQIMELVNKMNEQLCKCRISSKKRLLSVGILSKQISLNTDECSRLSEDITTFVKTRINTDACSKSLENEFSEEDGNNVNQTEKKIQEGNETNDHKHNGSILMKLFNNSLPCVLHITGSRESKLQKMLWIFIHTVAILISSVYIQAAYNKWQDSPIVQSLVMTKSGEIPFPSATLCLPIALKEEYDRVEILHRCVSNETTWTCSDEELKMLIVSMDISNIENVPMQINGTNTSLSGGYEPVFDYMSLTRILPQDRNRTSISGMEYLKYIEKLSEGCLDIKIYSTDFEDGDYQMISSCEDPINTFFLGNSVHYNNSEMYKCLTFNGVVNRPQSKQQNGDESSKQVFVNTSTCNPDNIIGTACKSDILYTDNFLGMDITKSGIVGGATKTSKWTKMFIHYPFDFPTFTTMLVYEMSIFDDWVFYLKPQLDNTGKDITEINASKRNCIFSSEKELSLFRYYTHHNCMLECQINCTLFFCGCIPYTLVIVNSSHRVCSKSEADNCSLISDFFHQQEFRDTRCQCDCPLACVSVSYEVEYQNYYDDSTRMIRFMYEKPVFPSRYRHSVSSLTEFVAYSFGILGVFNGFMVALCEILYWLTLRLWANIKRINDQDLEKEKNCIYNTSDIHTITID